MAIKKSEFVGTTVIADTSTFDFVIDGQNLKILKSDFLAALGVTGTLSQSGVIGVPVLDVSGGTDNKIRNLIAGNGMEISVHPQNGIIIAITGGVSPAPNITETTINYTALVTDDYVTGLTGGITLELPLLGTADRPVVFTNASLSAMAISGNGETVPNGTVLGATIVRAFLPSSTGWLEL